MLETTKYFCVERNVPSGYTRIADQKAIEENSANRSPFEAVIVKVGRRWLPGRTLHIAFLEGAPELQQKVIFWAKQWCRYANITFLFENHAKAEMRITFQTGIGTWSAIGTDALLWHNEPTMNFDDLTTSSLDEDFSYYVLHEFGHALGLLHEHQSSQADIQWNKEAVKKSLPGYSDEWFETNIFKRSQRSQTQYSAFDPYSIMLYSIPKAWTLTGFETPVNRTLSETDKQYIQKWYPR
jgi:serralysin